MSLEMGLTFLIIGTVFTFLLKGWLSPDYALFSALALLMLLNVISTEEALKGFSNEGVLTVILLLAIGKVVQKSSIIQRIVDTLLSKSKKLSMTLMKMMFPVSMISAVLNNTPIVAMLLPVVQEWGKKQLISPSKLLIPLSYAAILGGTITLVGTSTNLILHGLLVEKGQPGFSMFDFAIIGIPVALLGILYISFIGSLFLPSKTNLSETFQKTQDNFFSEYVIPKGSILSGKTVADGSLRALKTAYLIKIKRGKDIFTSPSSTFVLQEGDQLIFSGDVKSIITLHDSNDLILSEKKRNMEEVKTNGQYMEVVISHYSPLINKRINNSQFRSRYQAVILAIRRKNKVVYSRVGNERLQPGDTLLLLTTKDFYRTWHHSPDFYFLSSIKPDNKTLTHERTVLFILGGFLILLSFQLIPILQAALLTVLSLLFTRVVSFSEFKQSTDLSIYLVMSCSIGIGYAIENTGIAQLGANGLLLIYNHLGVFALFVALYVMTNVLTEIINNIGSAVMMFPIGYKVAIISGIDPTTIILLLAIAASLSFITPIGYQTNLLIFGPGGYRLMDYVKIGLPLSVLCMFITVSILVFTI
ncbi:SLC13 family permease [Evansella tamaricis]|uniref:SLC13 family permease n=1 Tax=Evansella tamaricis TaxID=2069301 RepID=A0ABS6JKH2_9BACI|nr:SLC13 family permease [Evansella tamaricis]MBU9713317.1 SLC13 family permease [Evansella tamaricis]